jgi:hypothetical protein
MKRTGIRVFAIVILIISMGAGVFSQGRKSLPEDVKNAVSNREVGWTLDVDSVYLENADDGSPGAGVIMLSWKSKSDYVDANLTIHSTSGEAIKQYTDSKRSQAFAGRDFETRKDCSFVLGDQCFLWTGITEKNTTGVEFIKGRIIVNVGAGEFATAKKFAEHIVSALPEK